MYKFIQNNKRFLFKKIVSKYPEYEKLRKYLVIDYPTPNEFTIVGNALLFSKYTNDRTSAIWTSFGDEHILKGLLDADWRAITIIKNKKGHWHSLNVNGYESESNTYICDDPHGNYFTNYRDLNGANLKFEAKHLLEINYGKPLYICSSLFQNMHQKIFGLFSDIPHYRIDF
ncbi:hypothetical protein EHQ13_16360 [Leptospira gomenensis]|uniref:Uncharacterized protein n=1 Tax=Leptospira gomenensis TaxID=2484974 RepID=A0A5F1YIH9_9LEPT|nr:hypothetical protein [Leptospira gomenensis]TGK38477.1 hypothetical protein EHQ17_02245 [Leptospira gomenensis]TGK42592.1 hypothetical protein EHQ07_14340 [Leptospira gomenensis]TGK55840.1 hypothetical protein EHQ13_16360 [Leptospira gomenensis]